MEGPGEMVAVKNGDATGFVPSQSQEREAFNGKALAIASAKKGSPGSFKVKSISGGLQPGEIKTE